MFLGEFLWRQRFLKQDAGDEWRRHAFWVLMRALRAVHKPQGQENGPWQPAADDLEAWTWLKEQYIGKRKRSNKGKKRPAPAPIQAPAPDEGALPEPAGEPLSSLRT